MKKNEVVIEDQVKEQMEPQAVPDLSVINKSLDAIGVKLNDEAQPNLVDRTLAFFAGILKGVREQP